MKLASEDCSSSHEPRPNSNCAYSLVGGDLCWTIPAKQAQNDLGKRGRQLRRDDPVGMCP